MITFKTLIARGYLALANKEVQYDLDKHNLNILKAPNGKGKTTLFSALFWTLYGKGLKGINNPEPWDSIKTKDYVGVKNELTFYKGDVSYTVIRCYKYKREVLGHKGNSRLILIKNGIPQDHLRDKRDVQEAIQEILGVSSDLFLNTIIFGQKMTRLVSAKGPEKKAIFEELFNISFIDKAKKVSDNFVKEYRNKITPLQNSANILERDIAHYNRAFESANDMYKKEQNSPTASVTKEIQEELIQLKSKMPPIEDLDFWLKRRDEEQKNIEKCEELLEEIKIQDVRISTHIDSLNKEKNRLRKIISQSKSSCPTCKRPFDNAEELEAHKEINEKTLASTEKQLSDFYSKLNNPRKAKVINELSTARTKVKEYEEKLKIPDKINAKIKEKESQIETHKIYEAGRQERLAEHKRAAGIAQSMKIDKMEELEEITNKLHKLNTALESFQWVSKEPFSNKGIKAYIFDSMLKKLNTILKENYAPLLGFNVFFEVDMESTKKDIETYIVKDNHVKDYKELSGGQAQLIDISVAFAMHDLGQETVPTNILVLDEVFESLDSQNIEKVQELIKLKTLNTKIHLITHSNHSFQNANIIEIISKREGYIELSQR